jgi:hypothetical protein
MKKAQLTLSALVLLLPASVAASPEATLPRIFVVEPAANPAPADNGLWRPAARDVERARAALIAYLSVAHSTPDADQSWNERNRPEIRDKIDTYLLQFAGVRRGDGRQYYSKQGNGPRAILITGMCQNPFGGEGDLTTGIVLINDGGSCYFTAIYDPAEDRIAGFYVNAVL